MASDYSTDQKSLPLAEIAGYAAYTYSALEFLYEKIREGGICVCLNRREDLSTCLAVVTTFLAATAAEKTANSGVLHFDHDKVAAVFDKGGVLLATNNFKIMGLRRDKAGEAEIHDLDTDVIYVLEGSATFVTGGQATEPRTISRQTLARPSQRPGEKTASAAASLIAGPGVTGPLSTTPARHSDART